MTSRDRDRPWFFIALFITLLIHISAIAPVSKLINQRLIPYFSDESIEIDLSEIHAKPKKVPDQKLIPPLPTPPEKKLPPLILPDEPEHYVFRNLPKKKKVLVPGLKKDKVVKKETGENATSPPKAVEKKKEVVKKSVVEKKDVEKKDTEDKVPLRSPLFINEPESPKKTDQTEEEAEKIPEAILKTFRGGEAEKTDDDTLQFSMNTYKWTFEHFAENWAIDLQRWWKLPLDYAYGKVPDGGDVWIEVDLSKSGELLGYTILQSKVTAEMELAVVKALVDSLKRPALPGAFPKDRLIVYWRFIYPPVRPELKMRQ